MAKRSSLADVKDDDLDFDGSSDEEEEEEEEETEGSAHNLLAQEPQSQSQSQSQPSHSNSSTATASRSSTRTRGSFGTAKQSPIDDSRAYSSSQSPGTTASKTSASQERSTTSTSRSSRSPPHSSERFSIASSSLIASQESSSKSRNTTTGSSISAASPAGSAMSRASQQQQQPSPEVLKSLFGPARTKTARAKLKQQQQEPLPSTILPSKTLQLEPLSKPRLSTTSTTATASTHNSSNMRRPPRPPSSSSNHSAMNAKLKTGPATIIKTLKQPLQPSPPLPQPKTADPPRCVVRNIYAAQDSGNWQLLLDDLEHYSSILSSTSISQQPGVVTVKTLESVLAATLELTVLLSDHTNRSLLHQDLRVMEELVLQTALPCIVNVLVGNDDDDDDDDDDDVDNEKDDTDQQQPVAEQIDTTATLDDGSTTVQQRDADDSKMVKILHKHLYTCTTYLLHFLTLDATKWRKKFRKQVASPSRIRDLFLKSPTTMQAIVRLIRLDPIVHRMRDKTTTATATKIRRERVQAAASIQIAASPMAAPSRNLAVSSSQQSSGSGAPNNGCGSSIASSLGSSPGLSTASASPSVNSLDPTVAGRKRLRAKKNSQQRQGDADTGDDALSFATSQSSPARLVVRSEQEEKHWETIERIVQTTLPQPPAMEHASSSLDAQKSVTTGKRPAGTFNLKQPPKPQQHHTCSVGKREQDEDQDTLHNVSHSLPLLALNRIILGKMEYSEDDEEEDVMESCFGEENGNNSNGNDDENDDDIPLLRTNRLIGESNILPLLSSVLMDSLSAITKVISDTNRCLTCCSHLQDRIQTLVSLVDGACLLNDNNRACLCQEGFSYEFGGCLIVGLFGTLVQLHERNLLLDKQCFGDVSHELLRLLTSLTHENPVAAKESDVGVGQVDKNDAPTTTPTGSRSRKESGTSILARILYSLVQSTHSNDTDDKTEKLQYDSTIFCLNTLTNLVESNCYRSSFATIRVGEENLLFLSWLTQWLVDQTGSFCDAIMGSTFGSSPSKHADRRLLEDEEENLMIAGNGFVLLVCLLLSQEGNAHGDTTRQLRDIIMANLPGSGMSDKIAFLKNSLKAFCNLYHYKIGDLAVAVVTPVKNLMLQLDAIHWD